ncbi:hypothetical protein CP967_31175 [Streptomyces nitrosporeus]|uniref:Uncharacterized protein n=1 Tax=Streptomyces nitrosporeus TaxID=28894 RepID=A0A5J6FKE2_9ACTN|nr:hypothetical protein [Streptomyces nitrosporeus]QEU75834.1 hypothetical protein CP967_31175 [Streptomyces nitrosporeus]GGY88651.1 hypothetical protein GCM10010327_19210 [Streptomyces nitrosporeus]
MKTIRTYLNDLSLRLYVRLQIFAAQEPVRLRAALTSVVLALAFFIPSLAQADIADHIVTVGAVALPILMGESTRKKVTPAE